MNENTYYVVSVLERAMTPNNRNSAELTERQIEVVLAIHALQSRDGLSPSIAEISKHLKTFDSNVFRLVGLLKVKGFVTSEAGRCRSLRLTPLASTITARQARKK
jgi:DNA-binding IscR family transcriptional regulator